MDKCTGCGNMTEILLKRHLIPYNQSTKPFSRTLFILSNNQIDLHHFEDDKMNVAAKLKFVLGMV